MIRKLKGIVAWVFLCVNSLLRKLPTAVGCLSASFILFFNYMSREQIAFFDVDHTISRHATSLWFALVCMRHRLISWFYILLVPGVYILYRFFKLGIKTLFKHSLPRLAGISHAKIQAMAREAFDKYLEDGIYPGAIREIATLKKEGVHVILATSSPFEVVYPLAQYLQLTPGDIVATQFAYKNGVFTGEIVGSPVFSRTKCSIIRDFAERSGADLQYCSFYTDSIHDLPLLELVGRPVAVHPDTRLAKIARKRGWLIKDFSV